MYNVAKENGRLTEPIDVWNRGGERQRPTPSLGAVQLLAVQKALPFCLRELYWAGPMALAIIIMIPWECVAVVCWN